MLRERRRAANFKPNRRLDRKSSRGMIYENEELRLRTININAEVERGQSDIRKLRRENEQLRREIWSLRDEYDRLDQILRQDKQQGGGGEQSGTSSSKHHKRQHREERSCCGQDEEECDGEEDVEEEEDGDECCSCNRSGGEDHCEECDSGDNYCDDEDCNCCGAEGGGDPTCDTNKEERAKTPLPTEGGATAAPQMPASSSSATRLLNGTSTGSSSAKSREHLHVNFDHLSIVSEENLTGSDGSNSVHNLPADAVEHHNCLTVPPALGLLQQQPAKDGKDPKAAPASHSCYSSSSPSPYSSSRHPSTAAHLMSLPATPCSPLLTDFQSLVPPLKHFENINYDDIKPLPSSSSSSTVTREPPSGFVCPSVRSKFIAKASSKSSSPVAVSSPTAAVTAAACAAELNLSSPAADVPAVAPSPEPPDSPSPPSPLLPIVASSISSSDWIANNKTVSFSTFRPPTASSVSQWSLSNAAGLDGHPVRACDSSQRLAWEEGEIVPISPKPKHFFAPLKSARSPKLPSSPDLYVHDVLASPNGSSNSINVIHESVTTVAVMEPIYTTIHKSRPSYPLSITCSPIGGAVENPLYASQISPTASGPCAGGSYMNPVAGSAAAMADGSANHVPRCTPRSPTTFQVGGNLEELLQDIESMAEEVAHLDLNGAHGEVDGGSNRLVPVSPRELGACSSDLTPPPNLPEPMNLLPATLPYLDFKSNTAVITTPKAAMANRSALAENSAGAAAAPTTVTSVVSKPISSATAVRKKLFGKKNKEPVINEPVVPLKLTIPPTLLPVVGDHPSTITDDKVNEQQHSKLNSPVVGGGGGGDGETYKRKSRRVSLSFPGFGGSKKSVPEDEKDTSSLENLAAAAAVHCPATSTSNGNLQSQSQSQGQGKKQAIHRVSSGADISSISTSIGSPSTPIKGPCQHHRHNSQKGKAGGGRSKPGHSRTSSESQNVFPSPGHGHHHCDMLRRNSTMNDALTTSMSERNSNSLASSRESSTSLSMRSQKSRRISENSHSNGKIPWCGCWGNGCL